MELQDPAACFWCSTSEMMWTLFRAYSSLPAPDWTEIANENITHCMDCVRTYHHGRAAVVADEPDLEQVLFPIEVKRLQCSLNECAEDLVKEHKDVFDSNDSDDTVLYNYWGNSQQEACPLPIPVQEILRFPFYLQDEDVNKNFCRLMKVLQKAQQLHIKAVDKPLIGLFLLLIHPNNVISNWANKSVAHLGNSVIERCEEFAHVVSLMVSVISFGLFEDRTISSFCEEPPSARRILSSHLFPHQQLVYWQGLGCLLHWISKENLYLLGSELHSEMTTNYSTTLKETNFETDDEENSFWPKLEGFQELVDKLGFRIWQYLKQTPDGVFNSIFNHACVRNAVDRLKMENTQFEHQLANGVHGSAPYTWIRAFVSSLLEFDSIAEQCVTMVLDKMTNEINECLTNQMKPSSNRPIENQEPSEFLEHSISSLVEILECLLTFNFCVSLPCFEKCFNVMVLFLTKFQQQEASSQHFTNWQASPLRFIRNLLKICVKRKISLTESLDLVTDIDSVCKKQTHFTDIDQNLLKICVQNLVQNLHNTEIEDTVKIYNEEGGGVASTSTALDEHEEYCNCTFEPFVRIKEEIPDIDFPDPSPDFMFEDSSITNNFESVCDEIILISSDSEDDLPDVPGLLNDQVIVKKEIILSDDDLSDDELLLHHGIIRSVSVEVKKLTLDDSEQIRQAPCTVQYTASNTVQDTASYTVQDTVSYTVQDTVPYTEQDTAPYIEQETAPYSEQDAAPYTEQDTAQDTASYTEQDTAPYTELDTAPYTEQDTAPYTEQDTAPYTVQDTVSYTEQDTAPYTVQGTVPYTEQDTAPYTEQETAPYTVQDTVSYTEQDTTPYTEQDTAPYTEQDTASYTEQDTASYTINISSDTSSDGASGTAQYTAPDISFDHTPYKYTPDRIRDIKNKFEAKIKRFQENLKAKKYLQMKGSDVTRQSVIESDPGDQEAMSLPPIHGVKRPLTQSYEYIESEATSDNSSCDNVDRTAPSSILISDSDSDAMFQTLTKGPTSSVVDSAPKKSTNSTRSSSRDQMLDENKSKFQQIKCKATSWISPKRSWKLFGCDADSELSSSDVLSSSDIEAGLNIPRSTEKTTPEVCRSNLFFDILSHTQSTITPQRQEVQIVTTPTNKSGTLINADSSIDKQVASVMYNKPPSTNTIPQRENMLPLQTVPEPARTEDETAGRPHQQRTTKTHQQKHIPRTPKTHQQKQPSNRFSSRTASFVQDLAATTLQSKITNKVSVTQCRRFPSSADNQVPSEELATCSTTTAATQQTRSSFEAVGTAVQCQSSWKEVNLKPTRVINLDLLVAVVLSWDPEWLDNQVNPNQIVRQLKMDLKDVPLCFDSIDSYIKVFVPLLLLETWHYVVQAYERNIGTGSNCLNMKYIRRYTTNSVMSGCFLTCKQQLYPKDVQMYPSDRDLVIVSLGTSGEEAPSYRIFAMVTNVNFQQIKGKASKQPVVLECILKLQVPAINENFLMEYIRQDNNIQIQVVTSMISHHRLFMCFKDLHKHLLARDILRPRVRPVPQTIASPNPAKLITKLNACQSEAAHKIFTCMEMELVIPNISLLHGPPGTGKTRTIINIVERILKKKRHVDNSPLLPGQTCNNIENRPRILVCAPSNTAVDRLVLNVVEMCLAEENHGDRLHDPRFNCGLYNIVRVGNNVHPKCMRFQITNMTAKQMKKASENANNGEAERIRKEISDCQKALEEAELRCGNLQFSPEASMLERQQAEHERDNLHKQLKDLKKKKVFPNIRSTEMRESILRHADVVFSTLNGSGSNHLDFLIPYPNRQPHFKYVIVDEACQCTELDTLIPLHFKGTKLLLVGDPHQLPATVLSEGAKKLGLHQSLFERMYKYYRTLKLKKSPVHFLRTQYRMHPEICKFPSQHFYNNKLETFGSIQEKYKSFPFKPYLVFDIIDGREEISNDKNIRNEAECNMVIALVLHLVPLDKLRIGIITPYKKQKLLLEDKVQRLANTDESIGEKIEISTVDGFQGQEKDVIILSCVRARGRGSSIGFVADRNRMNVALTRAKMALYLVGHMETLQTNKDWRALVWDAEKRDLIHPVHDGEYKIAAELCRKDTRSHNSKNRRGLERQLSKDANGRRKGLAKEARGSENVLEEGDGGKGQELVNGARGPCVGPEKENRGQGRVMDKVVRPDESASDGQNNERSANLPHAGHTREGSQMERSGEEYSSVGSKSHNLEPLEEGEIRDDLVPSTSSGIKINKRSKDVKKNAKDLREVTEAVNSKHPKGPLVKVIPGLPPNPVEQRRRQGRSGNQIDDQHHRRLRSSGNHEEDATQQRRKHKRSGNQEGVRRQQRERHVSSGNQEGKQVQQRKRHRSSGNQEGDARQQHEKHVSSGNQKGKQVQKRKRHGSSGNQEGNARQQRRRHSSSGNQEGEPVQKCKRHSRSGSLESNQRQQHEMHVHNGNQELQDAQRDRSSTTISTVSIAPKLPRLQRGKKRIAHKPREESFGHFGPDLASEGHSSQPQGDEEFQMNERANGCNGQSTVSSTRSERRKSILMSPSRRTSNSFRRISFSLQPEVRYFVTEGQADE